MSTIKPLWLDGTKPLIERRVDQLKFFVPFGFRSGKDSHPNSQLGIVYGPYEDDKAVEEALARRKNAV